MPVSHSTLRAHICVALKSVPKPVREAFGSRDWLEREGAERAIAETVIAALGAFDMEQRSAIIPPARSVYMRDKD